MDVAVIEAKRNDALGASDELQSAAQAFVAKEAEGLWQRGVPQQERSLTDFPMRSRKEGQPKCPGGNGSGPARC